MTRGKVPLIGIGSVFLFFRPDFNCEVRSMNSPLHTVSALLVSASEAQTKRIGALLTRARIVPFEHADSVRQALDLFDAGGIDGVLIAEPVTGSSGQELALQLKKRRCMAVLLLAEPTHADAAAALLEQSGVLVLPNDAPEALIVQTIRLLAAVRADAAQDGKAGGKGCRHPHHQPRKAPACAAPADDGDGSAQIHRKAGDEHQQAAAHHRRKYHPHL